MERNSTTRWKSIIADDLRKKENGRTLHERPHPENSVLQRVVPLVPEAMRGTGTMHHMVSDRKQPQKKSGSIATGVGAWEAWLRSLNMDFENQDKEKDSSNSAGPFNGGSTNNSIQTIDSTQALFLPIGASVSLLVMFFFFDSVQVVFTICTAVLATIAFAFLLLPMCQYLTRPCSPQNKISFGCCGRFTAAELLSFSLSVMLVLIWVLTGHWLLMDALAMGLCVAMIAFVRLPSLKVSCLLLSGLLIYDVFWVFFSAYIFNSNVMVKVATQPADNPLDVLSRKLHLGPSVGRDVPRLSLPGKLVFPSSTGSHFSMLGIGDIVMPGLLLCFVLRYDNYKKQANGDSCGTAGPGNISGRMQKVSYFHCTLIGYFVGLLTATVASRIHRAAQPALLAIYAACGRSHSIRSPAAHGSWRYDGADGQRPNFCLVLFSLTACLPVPEAGLVLRSIASLWNLYRWTCCISRRRGTSCRVSSPASLPPCDWRPLAGLPSPPGPPPVYNSVPDHPLFLRGGGRGGGGGGSSLDQQTPHPAPR
ncbi:Signal peptide peptidase-like 3, partial [Ophiophagus hannah]